MLNKEFFTPSISRDYSMKEFRRDLKQVMQKAGVEAEKVTFYIEDHQLISSEILEYLNSVISAGEAPGLYLPEELEPILGALHDELRNQYECRTTFELFVRRVQQNLTVVVSLDNSHPQFLSHCASNPALYTKCSILWHEGWSREAMNQVALKEMEEELRQVEKQKDQLVSSALALHESASEFGASPLKFCNLVQNFKSIFNRLIAKSGGQTKHLKAGLKKLEDAAKMVDELQREAGEQKILLGEKQKEAKLALQDITVSMEKKGERKQEVEGLQA